MARAIKRGDDSMKNNKKKSKKRSKNKSTIDGNRVLDVIEKIADTVATVANSIGGRRGGDE